MKNFLTTIFLLFFVLFFAKIVAAGEATSGEVILAAANQKIKNIDTKNLQKLLAEQKNTVLIDVRTASEIAATGTISGGQNVNIPRGWLEFRIGDFAADKNTPIVVYCGQNLRSPLAAKTLQDMGYSNVQNYAEGYFKWRDEGLSVYLADFETDNILYRKPVKVAENVYSAIGATQPPTYQNSNHNNNLSFIVTTDGVLVFNAGGSYLLAQAMHQEIKKITKQKVKVVVLENSQGHAMLGSNYWREQGATIIAHTLAAKEIEHNFDDIYSNALRVQKDKLVGVKKTIPDKTFDKKMHLKMGKTKIELLQIGPTHSPDDISLMLPEQALFISGDATFNERMLPVFEHTDISKWIKTWDKIEQLNPKIIIPGHGKPTDLATVTKFTKDYLVYMHQQVKALLDNDGELIDAYKIDQSAYQNWGTYRELHRQNAERIFKKMEFE